MIPKSINDFTNGFQAWFAIGKQRLIEIGAGNTRLFSDFGHTFCTGSSIQGMGEFLWRAGRRSLFEKFTDVFVSFKVFGKVNSSRFHGSRQFIKNLLGFGNVFVLP